METPTVNLEKTRLNRIRYSILPDNRRISKVSMRCFNSQSPGRFVSLFAGLDMAWHGFQAFASRRNTKGDVRPGQRIQHEVRAAPLTCAVTGMQGWNMKSEDDSQLERCKMR